MWLVQTYAYTLYAINKIEFRFILTKTENRLTCRLKGILEYLTLYLFIIMILLMSQKQVRLLIKIIHLHINYTSLAVRGNKQLFIIDYDLLHTLYILPWHNMRHYRIMTMPAYFFRLCVSWVQGFLFSFINRTFRSMEVTDHSVKLWWIQLTKTN